MPQPCTVCTHPDRPEIDRRLSSQACNVAALARELGLDAKAMTRHRARHIPQLLVAFTAKARTLTLEQLEAEAERLYVTTLDALARAEQGTLAKVKHVDPETGEVTYPTVRTVSHTAVGRMIREARAGLVQLVTLAGERPDDEGRPTNVADGALSADTRTALEAVLARTQREGGPTDQVAMHHDAYAEL